MSWTLSGTTPVDPHTALVEQDDVAVGGEAVDQGEIPVVEVAPEVLHAEQRGRLATSVAVSAVTGAVLLMIPPSVVSVGTVAYRSDRSRPRMPWPFPWLCRHRSRARRR
jgi:hypothetical protein